MAPAERAAAEPSTNGASAGACAASCCAGGARRAGGGAGGAAWRAALAELCGTLLLVLLSCLPGAASAATPLHRALTAGFVVTALVQALDHVSGAYFNPAVLLAAALWRRVAARRALLLLAAQLAGAALGAGALVALAPGACGACVTVPARGVGAARAALLEALLGGCLALANCGAWDERNAAQRDSWPLRIGVTVAALSLAAGSLTGASMNPARSFGPALWSGDWAHHWVYWAGPLSGALLATLAYRAAWRLPPAPYTDAARPQHGPRTSLTGA